jgi:hypothetical protein
VNTNTCHVEGVVEAIGDFLERLGQ